MNEEARKAAWLSLDIEENFTVPKAMVGAFREVHGRGWDAARTFSAEDLERVADVIHANHAHMRGEFDGCRDLVRAILAAIGTVEEAP